MSDILDDITEPDTRVSGGQDTSSEAPATTETATDSAPKSQSLDDTLSGIWEKHHSPAKPSAPAPAKLVDQPRTAAREPATSSPAIDAPPSWSAEKRELFTQLPPAAQEYVRQREQEVSQYISRAGEALKAYEPIGQVYQAINQMGVPQGREAEVIQSWYNAERYLNSNPVEGLKWLAQNYGVDLATLAGQQPKTQQEASAIDDLFKDPRVEPLTKEINDLKTHIQRLTGHVTAKDQAENHMRSQEAESLIRRFAADKPDFAELENDISHMVALAKARDPQASQQQLLEKAYDMARHANPQTRERIVAEQRKAEADRSQKEAAQKQAQAKKLASMNVRTGASATTSTFDGRWDDNDKISALYDRIQAGR